MTQRHAARTQQTAHTRSTRRTGSWKGRAHSSHAPSPRAGGARSIQSAGGFQSSLESVSFVVSPHRS